MGRGLTQNDICPNTSSRDLIFRVGRTHTGFTRYECEPPTTWLHSVTLRNLDAYQFTAFVTHRD